MYYIYSTNFPIFFGNGEAKSEIMKKLNCFKCNLVLCLQLNHFPGSFQIGRKDRLWRNLSKLQVQNGKKEFGFFPQTFVLPSDMKLLKRAWEDGGTKQKWIVKPVRESEQCIQKIKYYVRPYKINF
jgi:hypothetical protein